MNLSLSETPKSNDALFLSKDNKLIFVEFKNGFMDNAEKFSVRKKIYDSIIILTDIFDTGISNLKGELEYILVYNESINSNEYVCFGIKIFENYCFSKVHTYTEAEFEEFLTNN